MSDIFQTEQKASIKHSRWVPGGGGDKEEMEDLKNKLQRATLQGPAGEHRALSGPPLVCWLWIQLEWGGAVGDKRGQPSSGGQVNRNGLYRRL